MVHISSTLTISQLVNQILNLLGRSSSLFVPVTIVNTTQQNPHLFIRHYNRRRKQIFQWCHLFWWCQRKLSFTSICYSTIGCVGKSPEWDTDCWVFHCPHICEHKRVFTKLSHNGLCFVLFSGVMSALHHSSCHWSTCYDSYSGGVTFVLGTLDGDPVKLNLLKGYVCKSLYSLIHGFQATSFNVIHFSHVVSASSFLLSVTQLLGIERCSNQRQILQLCAHLQVQTSGDSPRLGRKSHWWNITNKYSKDIQNIWPNSSSSRSVLTRFTPNWGLIVELFTIKT